MRSAPFSPPDAGQPQTHGPSAAARLRMRKPLFRADWSRAVFIHYEVEPSALQQCVPFPLHLREGRAYVSLVAFTLRRLRPRIGGRTGRWLLRPISDHQFLNVRTYVCAAGEPGIYFLAEWLSTRLAVPLGPICFGLPYRLGKIAYQHQQTCALAGRVKAGSGEFRYRGEVKPGAPCRPCLAGTLDEFLLERYTAFTCRGCRRRFFRVWHEPWPQSPATVVVEAGTLLRRTGLWFREARVITAHYSPGVEDVWMGPPEALRPAQ